MSILSFHFDYSSPFAYLGATQVERVARAHDATLRWCPFLLGALFKSIGTPNVPLFEMSASKQEHAVADMHRWADHYGVPLTFPTRFPMNTVKPLRMSLQLGQADRGRLVVPLMTAYWGEDRDISDPEELTKIADDAGFEGAALVAGCADPEVKQELREATSHAEERGICGAPCFVVQRGEDDQGVLFWGQDRLLFVEKALAGWRPKLG